MSSKENDKVFSTIELLVGFDSKGILFIAVGTPPALLIAEARITFLWVTKELDEPA